MKQVLTVPLVALSLCLSCWAWENQESEEVGKKENPFIKYPSTPFGDFEVYATAGVSKTKVSYSAQVFSQWLDNDEDGVADNPEVLQKLKDRNTVMVLATVDDGDYDRLIRKWIMKPGERRAYFGAYGGEIHPGAIEEGIVVGPHCGTWEEFFHLISDVGFAGTYPSVFGTRPGTELTDAMDIARGGHSRDVPEKYPDDAWYSYYDEGCGYGCQASEYIYWLVGTLLGARDFHGERIGSCEQIQREWKPCTAEELKAIDPIGYALVTNPKYKFPTRLPDGHYVGKVE